MENGVYGLADPCVILLRKASCGDVGYLKQFHSSRDTKYTEDLLRKDRHGNTALHWASRFGHAEFVDEKLDILKCGATSSNNVLLTINNKGDTAAHEAIRNNHVDIAMNLLKKDPRLSTAINSERESLLYLAAERGHREVVSHLLGQPSVFRDDGPQGRTALHAALGAPSEKKWLAFA